MKDGTEKFNICYEKAPDGSYNWVDDYGNRMHFTGSPKFIVQSLVKIFGVEKGQQVFDDFMKGVEGIKDLEFPTSWKRSPSTFVLYRKKRNYVNQSKIRTDVEKIQDREKEYNEDGEDSGTQDIR